MQEIFEKIKESLEEDRRFALYEMNEAGVGAGLERAIEIVNQVAEEFGSDINVGSNDVWIPCVNELPQEYTDVLGCDYDGYIYVVQLYKDSIFGKIWRQWNGGMLRLDVIIAWQPLPEPFKPKGE